MNINRRQFTLGGLLAAALAFSGGGRAVGRTEDKRGDFDPLGVTTAPSEVGPEIGVDHPDYYGMHTDAGNRAVAGYVRSILRVMPQEDSQLTDSQRGRIGPMAKAIRERHPEFRDGVVQDNIYAMVNKAWSAKR